MRAAGFVRCWWWVARAPCVLSRCNRRRGRLRKDRGCARQRRRRGAASPRRAAPSKSMEWSLGGRASQPVRSRTRVPPSPRPPPPALVGAEALEALVQWASPTHRRRTNAVAEQPQRCLEEAGARRVGREAALRRSHTARCSPCAAASPRLARRSSSLASGRCSSTRASRRQLRREHASESALLRRELGAAAAARSRSSARSTATTRGTRRCCGASRRGRGRPRARAAARDRPRPRGARAPPRRPRRADRRRPRRARRRRRRRRRPRRGVRPPRHRDRGSGAVGARAGGKELFDAALAVHVACRARTSPQRGDGAARC